MSHLIPPHGCKLSNLLVPPGAERDRLEAHARSLPLITLDKHALSDLELLAVGGYSPLEGFMGSDDYESVMDHMRLTNGIVWPIPITLAVSQDEAKKLSVGQEVSLTDGAELLAVLHISEIFRNRKEKEAQMVYRTDDPQHPGVAILQQRGDVLLSGLLKVLRLPAHTDFTAFRLAPAETRELFHKKGWRRIVAFQTRNPIHRAHEYLQKCALEIVDALLLHPLVGATKGDDISPDVRMRSYQVIFDKYYPKDRVALTVFPAAMRYAGPREAIFHALVRKNYGCSHFIVGRDHAGAKSPSGQDYYGTYDAQHIFDEFDIAADLGIQPLFFEHTFYCKACGNMASYKTCPHTKDDHLILSGTKVRELLRAGQALPVEFTRPEVAKVLSEAMQEKG